jgi:CDGSH-type Zn-finger protein/ferredoxin
MSDQQVFEFPGSEIDVQWDGRLCIHVGECGNAAGDLFVAGREPWCIPDHCGKAEVREVIERCPSGALSYRDKDGSPEVPPAENTVTVAYNGPLYAHGDLAIEGAPEDMPGVRFRAALCRCGQSANKPFCDNSHLKAGFEDFGSVGERGTKLTAQGGPLTIKPLTDGPLLVKGNLRIRAGSGRLAWEGTEAALCRCGASQNKPFCDGSHRTVGFKSG